MKSYSELFVDSKIMESILPRKLTNAQELRDFNPFLLDEEDDYDYADFEGINDVGKTNCSKIYLGIFGPSL